MPHRNIINGNSEDEIWRTIEEQLTGKKDSSDYSAQFDCGKYCVTLDIDLDIERHEEDEEPVSSFSAQLPDEIDFTFNIQNQRLKQQIGKLFGMQDVVIGQPEFDKKFLIQTNNVVKVKEMLSNADVTAPLLNLQIDAFRIRERKIGANKENVLTLSLEGGVTEIDKLKSGYQSFKNVLEYL